MRYDPDKNHRRSIRLKGYDYAQPGVYFVTICVQHRECLFGTIVDGEMRLNDAGQMVESWWNRLPGKFPTIETDEFVVMPNHVHGIIAIVEPGGVVANPCVRPRSGQTHGSATFGKTVQWFKTMTTNAYIRGVKQDGWELFRANCGSAIITNVSSAMNGN